MVKFPVFVLGPKWLVSKHVCVFLSLPLEMKNNLTNVCSNGLKPPTSFRCLKVSRDHPQKGGKLFKKCHQDCQAFVFVGTLSLHRKHGDASQ